MLSAALRLPAPAPARPGYAVVDVETSGPSPRRHRVVEVAVVLLDGECRPEAEFGTLLDPAGPVGPTHIHGIADADVTGAPRFADVAHTVAGLLRGRVLVGHHVTCDRAFLASEYARLGVDLPPLPVLCTMRLAEEYLPDLAAPSLPACCAAAGLPDFPAHTALGDARATAGLFRHYAGRGAAARPAAWGQALFEATAVQWPHPFAPRTPQGRRGGVRRVAGRNARCEPKVPTVRKGGA